VSCIFFVAGIKNSKEFFFCITQVVKIAVTQAVIELETVFWNHLKDNEVLFSMRHLYACVNIGKLLGHQVHDMDRPCVNILLFLFQLVITYILV
jgi:hypothetical protein